MADLIERKFNIQLGVTAVGALLAKLGLTPQKPLQRAYQRDPDAIEAWRLERFPAIARQAKTSGGEVYFWDECQSARKRDPLSASKIDPPAWWLVPVVHRGDPRDAECPSRG